MYLSEIEEGNRMTDLRTEYMGIDLKNPVIVGASKLTGDMSTLKELEKAGAGAVVTASLFEEQIRIQDERLEDTFLDLGGMHQTELNLSSFSGSLPEEHLYWVEKAVKTLDIPVIASLNATDEKIWTDWAKKLEGTGVAGLELNLYSVPLRFDRTSSDMEDDQIRIIRKVTEAVQIPVSVKLSPYYANPLNIMAKMDRAGARGFVLFNRFFQPDIDVHSMSSKYTFDLSSPMENRLALRFTALLHNRIKGSLCSSTGISSADDVIKMILAGADCVQMVSALYQNRISWLGSVLKDIQKWMKSQGFENLQSFRGKMDKENSEDPYAYERAQYVKILLESANSTGKNPLL